MKLNARKNLREQPVVKSSRKVAWLTTLHSMLTVAVMAVWCQGLVCGQVVEIKALPASSSSSSQATAAASTNVTTSLSSAPMPSCPGLSVADSTSVDTSRTPNVVCSLGVLAPIDLDESGLVDSNSFCSTLDTARRTAQATLASTCRVHVHVTFTRCLLGEVLSAAFADSVRRRDEALIGPPCSAPAIIISFLDKPVITWVPLLLGLDLKVESEKARVQGRVKSGLAISSYGSYSSLATSVILTLNHFKWSRIAVVYSDDEVCVRFHSAFSDQLENSFTAQFVSFQLHNVSTLRSALLIAKTAARIIVTCTHPDSFHNLMTSADDLEMTSGHYAIVHVNLGTWPATGGSLKSEYVLKQLVRNVLFVGHFTQRWVHLVPATRVLSPSSNQSSTVRRGQFLDYFHDAVLIWAEARKRSRSGQTVDFANLTLTGRTGSIQLDEDGMRRRHDCVLHYQQGALRQVADLVDVYRTVLTPLWPGGSLPTDLLEPPPQENDHSSDKLIGAILGTLFVVLVVVVAAFLFRRWRLDRLSQSRAWQVEDRHVKRRHNYLTTPNGNAPQHRRLVRMDTRGTLGLGSICSLDRNQLFAPVGNYRGTVVVVRTLHSKAFRLTADVVTDFNILKDLHHDNINPFIGAHMEPGNSYVLFKYCAKGSLQDVLENEDVTLDWTFKMSFATDLARGMQYLHKSPLKSHGNLKSTNCVIDSRWVLKVTDFGVVTSSIGEPDDEMSYHAVCNSLLWTAPELLRLEDPPRKGTPRADVFSFAIILQEILLRVGPYGCNSNTPEEIIEHVKKGGASPFRPQFPDDHGVPDKALTLMMTCWEESPDQRLDFSVIRKRLFELNGCKKVSMLDNMVSLMETYSSRLEQLVADRTAELAQEKVKTDRLLYQMLPPSVAEQLKCGRAVVPEFYDAVSIFFSDIVGFTNIASQSKPLEVVDLLNDLYTAFDDVIFRRDVYKVETIGDAYMCVSGCPRRNGPRHASEIAEMGLDLVSTVMGVKVRHRPDEALQLRIGLHTGPCAAGVVGVAMPRYCLFGDTVNMASRMESTGKALHIHISSEMQEALEELDCGFLTLERGMIQVKGKGIHKTYWLVGKEGYTKQLPETFSKLRQTLDEASSRPPSPSNTSLTVGDGMYSALRKTSLAVSHVTVTSDSDDGSAFLPASIRSESGVGTGLSCPRNERGSSLPPIAPNNGVFNNALGTKRKHVTALTSDGGDPVQYGPIPRIEIS